MIGLLTLFSKTLRMFDLATFTGVRFLDQGLSVRIFYQKRPRRPNITGLNFAEEASPSSIQGHLRYFQGSLITCLMQLTIMGCSKINIRTRGNNTRRVYG